MVTNELASSEDDIAWLDDETDPGDNDGSDDEEAAASQPKKSSRWDNLNPKIKASIIKKGQERAIANKKKREPAQDKKRREYQTANKLSDFWNYTWRVRIITDSFFLLLLSLYYLLLRLWLHSLFASLDATDIAMGF